MFNVATCLGNWCSWVFRNIRQTLAAARRLNTISTFWPVERQMLALSSLSGVFLHHIFLSERRNRTSKEEMYYPIGCETFIEAMD